MINHNDYSIADLDSVSIANKANKTILEKPNPVDVGDFQSAMSQGSQCSGKSCDNKGVDSPAPASADDAKQSGGQANGDQMQKILTLLLQLLEMLKKSQGEEGDSESGDASAAKGSGTNGAGSNPAKIDDGKVVAENNVAAGDGQIPKPTEHKQSFNLGGKQMTIGGDGSASAGEVQQTKDTLVNLYENSSSFKNMIDSSPNDAFEVSVGKRSDNMSWGNADGRVFMNINNITPDSNDGFQALTAHEFAHAGVNMRHSDEMKQFEQTVAQEA
jgi:hypothetical protein